MGFDSYPLDYFGVSGEKVNRDKRMRYWVSEVQGTAPRDLAELLEIVYQQGIKDAPPTRCLREHAPQEPVTRGTSHVDQLEFTPTLKKPRNND